MTWFILHVQHQLWKWCCRTKLWHGWRSSTAHSSILSSGTQRGHSRAASFNVPSSSVPKCGHKPSRVSCLTTTVSMCPWFHWACCRKRVSVLTGATLSYVDPDILVGEIPMKFTLWNNFLQQAWKALVPTLHYDLEAPFWFCRNKMKVFLVSDFCG